MKILGQTVLLVTVLVAPCGRTQEAAAPPPAPKIACLEAYWDFGDQPNTGFVEHVFAIRNEGQTTLMIGNIRPTCGCTVAEISSRSLEPGAEATLSARLDLRGRTGRQMKQIHIESNDPAQPTFTLTLTGNAVAEVQVNPSSLFFGRLSPDAVVTGRVEILAAPSAPLRVTGVSTDNEILKADVEILTEGQSYAVLIRTQPPLSPGSILGRVIVQTDHPGAYASLVITVTCVVGGGLTVAPTEIVLGTSDVQPGTRYIVLHSPDNQPFSLIGVEVPAAGNIVSTVFPMGDSGYRIQLDNLTAAPELNGAEIRIRTSMADMPLVTIPIRIVAPSP